jgi:hypothetical protein
MFLFQGYAIKAFMALGIVIRFKPFSILWDFDVLKMAGGIVIPKLKPMHNEKTLNTMKNTFRYALLAGPLATYISPLLLAFVYMLSPSPFVFLSLMIMLGISFIFHQSFYIQHASIYGDIYAYRHLKSNDDMILYVYHQHSMLYELDLQTIQFIYNKAFQRLKFKESLDLKKDLQLLLIVFDGYRLGYLKEHIEEVISKMPSRHPIYKHESNALFLINYILIMWHIKLYDTASYYFHHVMKNHVMYQESLDLLNHYVYHETIHEKTLQDLQSMLFVYHHIVDHNVFRHHFRNTLSIELETNV